MPRLGARQGVQKLFMVRRRNITLALALGFLGGTILSGATMAQTNEQGARWYSQDLAGLTSQASGLAEGDAAGLALNWAAGAPLSKGGPLSKVGPILADLYHEHEGYLKQSGLKTQAKAFQTKAPLIRTDGDMVVIDAVSAGDPKALKRDLVAAGLTDAAVYEHIVSGRLPIAALDEVAGLASLRFAQPAMAMTFKGSVNSEGVAAMRVQRARKLFGVKGAGKRVGVLSDSYDCLGGAAADIASGDLPPKKKIKILNDNACPGSDEGRALMQIVSDVAPAAKLAFHTAFIGQAS
jgi:hypothetical protein